jgi:hypothetical protein
MRQRIVRGGKAAVSILAEFGYGWVDSGVAHLAASEHISLPALKFSGSHDWP